MWDYYYVALYVYLQDGTENSGTCLHYVACIQVPLFSVPPCLSLHISQTISWLLLIKLVITPVVVVPQWNCRLGVKTCHNSQLTDRTEWQCGRATRLIRTARKGFRGQYPLWTWWCGVQIFSLCSNSSIYTYKIGTQGSKLQVTEIFCTAYLYARRPYDQITKFNKLPNFTARSITLLKLPQSLCSDCHS